MFCYRRFGHTESDEPAFTQPMMYRKIAAHPSVRRMYADRLAKEGVVGGGEGDRMVADFQARLESEFEAAASYKPNKADWPEGAWAGPAIPPGADRPGATPGPPQTLRQAGM